MTQPNISTFAKWMALTAALLGWLFDGLEMGLFPLVAGPALADLLHQDYGTAPTDQQISAWLGIITALFLVGAATGGVLFGWLGDRFGRVKAMMLSVLTYALVSGLCGFATSAWQVGALRFVASLGMGGEWSLGVALITEIWPDSSRAFLAGLMGAAGNLGYLLIAVIGLGLAGFLDETRGFLQTLGVSEDFAKRLLDNSGWRFLMMLGAAPALLTFFIRIFVPESSRWQHEREKGATSHWNSHDLWGVLIGGLGAIGIILLWTPEFPHWLQALGIGENDGATPAIARVAGSLLGFGIALWGYTDPVRKFLGRAESDALPIYHRSAPTFRRMILGACLSGVALLGTWGSVQQAPPYARKLMIANETAAWRQANTAAKEVPTEVESKIKGHAQVAASYTQAASALGAVVGTLVAAWLANRFGRRITYFALCVGSLAIIPAFYLTRSTVDAMFYVFAFAMGGITASFYGWLPLYLPEIFRTAVRATGQGFGFNFGRILAAVGVLQLGNLTSIFHGGLPIACTVLCGVYVIGMAIIWLAPETKGQPLPE